ncbi:TolC family protein [Corallococcus sp. bb12-1]|uniref:TolC family protein n=1 Tax=Corallococcus sp. bb12-1 TaxID=2996784 RepID=UPI00226E9F15|nr:TolC family protein [Corallococcus sp. bb12-1]MCY1041739.1 TolC family protein [Corallococcus sp. bb12-1]
MGRDVGRVVAVAMMLTGGVSGAQLSPTTAPSNAPGTGAPGTAAPSPGSLSPATIPSPVAPGSQGTPGTPGASGTGSSAGNPAARTGSMLPPGPAPVNAGPAAEAGNAAQSATTSAPKTSTTMQGTPGAGAPPGAGVPPTTAAPGTGVPGVGRMPGAGAGADVPGGDVPENGSPGDSASATGEAPGAVAGTKPPKGPITLAQLVKLARTQDARVAEASAELRKFQALHQQAKWAWFPKFEITLGAGGPVPEARNDGLGGPPTTEASLEGDWNFGKVGVTVFSTGNAVLPLYTFGKLSALEKAGEQGPIVGAALRERVRAEAGFQAAQAYYGYQLARTGLKQLEDVARRLKDAGDRIDALLKEDSDQVAKLDTYKLGYFRQLVEGQRASALQGEQFALTAIRLLASAAPDEQVEVVEEELPLREDVTVPDLETALKQASERRPELKAISAGIIAREQEVLIRERSYYPDLGLAGFYDIRWTSSATRQRSQFAYDPYNDRTVGLGLVVRGTFDIPIKDAQLEQARAELDKLRAQEQTLKAGIQLEVTQVQSQLVAAYSRAKSFTEAEKNAKRWATAAYAAFDLGTGDTRELVDSFTALAQASAERGKSWFDVRVGMASLARVTGAVPASDE